MLVLLPFLLMVAIMVLNLYIITREAHEEIWFYIHKGRKGYKFVSFMLILAIMNLFLLVA